MSKFDIFQDPIGGKIYEAFGPEHDQYRSLGGLVRDTGIAPEAVKGFIEAHPDFFQFAPISPAGIPLYALSEYSFKP